MFLVRGFGAQEKMLWCHGTTLCFKVSEFQVFAIIESKLVGLGPRWNPLLPVEQLKSKQLWIPAGYSMLHQIHQYWLQNSIKQSRQVCNVKALMCRGLQRQLCCLVKLFVCLMHKKILLQCTLQESMGLLLRCIIFFIGPVQDWGDVEANGLDLEMHNPFSTAKKTLGSDT